MAAKYLKNTTQDPVYHTKANITFQPNVWTTADDPLLWDDQTYTLLGSGSFIFSRNQIDAYTDKQLAWDTLRDISPKEVGLIDMITGYKALITEQREQLVTMIRGPGGSGGPGSIKPIMREMDASYGGVARDTVITTADNWKTLFTYTGPGLLFGFVLTLESVSSNWRLRLIRDGEDVFLGSDGFSVGDLLDHSIFGFNRDYSTFAGQGFGLQMKTNILYFEAPIELPIVFSSSITIKVKRVQDSKKFKAGMVSFQKET